MYWDSETCRKSWIKVFVGLIFWQQSAFGWLCNGVLQMWGHASSIHTVFLKKLGGEGYGEIEYKRETVVHTYIFTKGRMLFFMVYE